MSIQRVLVGATVLAALATSGARSQPATDYPPGWPRPGATLLVENDRGAAYNVVYPKDQPTPMHHHRYFFAGLDLNTATIKVTQPDGKFDLHPVVKNHMWYLPKLTHQEMSTTDPGRNTVVIDIKEKTVPEATNSTNLPTTNTRPIKTKLSIMTGWSFGIAPGRPVQMAFPPSTVVTCLLRSQKAAIFQSRRRASQRKCSITILGRRSSCPEVKRARSDRPAAPFMSCWSRSNSCLHVRKRAI